MIDAKESAKIIKGRKICDLCLEENCIKDCEHSLGYSFAKTKAAFDDAIEALEKQIPKKPTHLESVPHYRCPRCNDAVKLYEESPTHTIKYCTWCGQALDWSDGNA